MEEYEKLEVQVVAFETEDIISGGDTSMEPME